MSRYQAIIAAYDTALAGRNAAYVDILDVLPVIYDVIPSVTPREIVAALRWQADRSFAEADALEKGAEREKR